MKEEKMHICWIVKKMSNMHIFKEYSFLSNPYTSAVLISIILYCGMKSAFHKIQQFLSHQYSTEFVCGFYLSEFF